MPGSRARHRGGCMGPSNPTAKQVNEFYNMFLGIFVANKVLDDPPANAKSSGNMSKMQEHRAEVLSKFKESIKEILFQDACEKF